MLGSPFAVTIGWQLAAPADEPAAQTVPGTTSGADGIGAAPVVSAAPSRPVTAVVDWPAPSPSPSAPTAVPPSRSPSTSAPAANPAPSHEVVAPIPSSLTVPPVPVPTDVLPLPTVSSKPPPDDATPPSSDLDPLRLLHKP